MTSIYFCCYFCFAFKSMCHMYPPSQDQRFVTYYRNEVSYLWLLSRSVTYIHRLFVWPSIVHMSCVSHRHLCLLRICDRWLDAKMSLDSKLKIPMFWYIMSLIHQIVCEFVSDGFHYKHGRWNHN